MKHKLDHIIQDKDLLHIRIQKILESELQKQKKSGKKFISDKQLDALIERIMKEELK